MIIEVPPLMLLEESRGRYLLSARCVHHFCDNVRCDRGSAQAQPEEATASGARRFTDCILLILFILFGAA
jgi:hypothetical protein